MSPAGFAYVFFDGARIGTDRRSGGRRLRLDARCLAGDAVAGAHAHVCALADPEAALLFDDPAVQQARSDALAWWLPLLGPDLVCVSTFALDSSRCAGAVTVARDPRWFGEDPFARLFPGTIVPTDLFSEVAPPPGPVIERYSGVPWPGEGF